MNGIQTQLPTVYVVQHNKIRGVPVDITPAYAYGNPVTLLEEGSQAVLHGAGTVREIQRGLENFGDQDYLLALGDPVAIGIACAIAAQNNGGRFKILKWDRKMNDGMGGYIPVQVDISTAY